MTFSIEHLHGAILEEVVLYLLKRSGYAPLSGPGGDEMLQIGRSGLELRGRGAWHQIDAIADFRVTPPFGNPIRLLVEAKFLSSKVGLPIIRNSAGVLKDVAENWVVQPGRPGVPARQRYSYLSAVFSATDFTEPAQQYAYAQDVYLVPLARSTYVKPVIDAIGAVTTDYFPVGVRLADIRGFLRRALLDSEFEPSHHGLIRMMDALHGVVHSCRTLHYGVIAMFGSRFPAFLVAAPDTDLGGLPERVVVRIRWRNGSWFVENEVGRRLFSFDLPDELFRLYAEGGELNRQAVAEMKGQFMSEFFAYHLNDNHLLRVIQFVLDQDWYAAVRERVGLP